MKKRFLSILLTAVLLLCAVPLGLGLVDTAYAAETANSGTCGDNVTWRLSDDGVLTISGTGAMEDYDIDNAPWYSFRSQVKSVVIEDGVTRIGISAFKNCDALTDVTIPNGVSSIGEYAFSDCSSLTSVTIPGSVTKIGGSVFYDCDALTDIYYDGYGIDWLKVDGSLSSLTGYTVRFKENLYGKGMCGDNVSWVMTADGTLTISGTGEMADYGSLDDSNPWDGCRKYIKSVVIEDGVTSIGRYTFDRCMSLTSVTIPDSVTSIRYGAFMMDTALTSLTIPGSVTSIENYAFYGCSQLTDVYYDGYGIDWIAAGGNSSFAPDTVRFKEDLYGKGACGDNVTWRLSADGTLTISGQGRINDYDNEDNPMPWEICRQYIKSVVIKSGVSGIGDYAFFYCDAMTSVTIPNTVTEIGDAVFCFCDALTSVMIPGSVTTIGEWAFGSCQALTSVTIPDSVTAIGNYAFQDCTGLTGVTIPKSVAKIEMAVFQRCTSLTSVTIPGSVTSIGGIAFRGCTSLKNVNIPSSVTTIDGGAFSGCTSLTSVTIPNSVTAIYGNAFSGCTSLTNLTIPDSVTTIGSGAFKDCSALTEIKLSSALKDIKPETFFNCVKLSSVTIPKRVCYIYQDAFRSCDSLADVYYGGTAADWAKITMEDGNGDLTNATLHCAAVPAAPVVKLGNSATSGKPVLTWNAVPGATSYKVYRATSKSGTYSLLGTVTTTSYTNTGAKEGTTYYYKVKAANGACESAYSNVVSGKVVVTPKPAAPVVKIGNSASSGKPMLTWNAVPGATSYKVYRATSQNGTYSLLGTVTATSYTNTGAKAGTTYYYRVKACNDAGLSPYSNIVSGQVKSVTPKPSAPVVKIGNSAASGKPMLTWNAVSGATSYKVYRATSQKGTYSLLGTVTATSYTNTGAKAGTTYYYKVKAVNSAGESAYSNVVSGRATVTTLTMGHSASSGKPQLTWKAVSGAASYKVYRATAKNGAYSVINTTKALTYTNTGAALGTTYYYKVEALNAAGKSMGFSAIVEGKVAPVLAVGYSSVSGKPQLTWKAVPGATEYQVYRSTQQNSGYSKINTTTSTSYVNTGAKAGTTYYYRIVAVKGTAVSDFSNIVSARPGK